MRLGSNSWELIFFLTVGVFISCCLRNPSLQVEESNWNCFRIGDSTGLHVMSIRHVSGSSGKLWEKHVVDVGSLFRQVLPGGLGGGLRAGWCLHLGQSMVAAVMELL